MLALDFQAAKIKMPEVFHATHFVSLLWVGYRTDYNKIIMAIQDESPYCFRDWRRTNSRGSKGDMVLRRVLNHSQKVTLESVSEVMLNCIFRYTSLAPSLEIKKGKSMLDIRRDIKRATWTVYGFAENPDNLTVQGYSLQEYGEDVQLVGIGFSFKTSPGSRPLKIFALTSGNAHENTVSKVSSLDEHEIFHIFQECGLDVNTIRSAAIPERQSCHLTIEGSLFVGEFYSWMQPCLISGFKFISEHTILMGSACGFLATEVLALLRDLVSINHRDEVILRYQRELEQIFQGLREEATRGRFKLSRDHKRNRRTHLQ
ncbi:MAG: hypothetical protein IMW89_20350 [Ktedonobacteraceae bacterium]|nr:hypothetical protein [Ktedonobacteraceae bacterium]